jgi:Immunity protein 26
MLMAQTLPYQEGDWFAVPLAEEQWAAGRVARLHVGGKIAFAYLFGPFVRQPPIEELAAHLPSEAVLIGRIGDQGLVRREWPVLGRADWRRDDWPLVPFRNVDPITKRVRRVEYEDGSLAAPTVWRAADDAMVGSPADTLYGHLSLQKRLSKMFTSEGRPGP